MGSGLKVDPWTGGGMTPAQTPGGPEVDSSPVPATVSERAGIGLELDELVRVARISGPGAGPLAHVACPSDT